MGRIEQIQKNYRVIPMNIRCVLLATLISNIGNGMHTIAISKLLYDKTGSALAFGGVILLDYIIAFAFQFISGSVVDRNNPKRVSIVCDLIRGIVIVFAGLMINYSDYGLYALTLTLIIVNIVNPFYRSCNFKIIPLLVKEPDQLLKMNGIAATLFQAGQLMGVALVAPMLVYLNSGWALVIDGVSFLIAALLVGFVRYDMASQAKPIKYKKGTTLYKDWQEVFILIKNEKSLLVHILMSSGDYLAINFINILLVPMVTQWYKNNSYCISMFDGGFAIGAMASIVLIYKVYKVLGQRRSSWIFLILEGFVFLGIIVSRWPIVTMLLTCSLGLFNAYSISVFQTALQERTASDLKGRISSLKNLTIYISSLILIPIVSKIIDYSLQKGILVCSCIVLIYGVISLLIQEKGIFGTNYLLNKNEVNV